MGFYIIQVSDTVTYKRTASLIVQADNEDEACEIGFDRANDGALKWTEEQIENTPYEAIPLANDGGTPPTVREAAEELPHLLIADMRPAGMDGDERELYEQHVRMLGITDDEIRRFNRANWVIAAEEEA